MPRKRLTLRELLASRTVNDLKLFTKRLGVPGVVTRKSDLVPTIEGALERDFAGFVGRLTEGEKLFLAEAAYHDGCVVPHVFEARYEQASPRGRLPSSRQDASLIHLLIYEDDETGDVCLAEGIAQSLRVLLPEPAPPKVKTINEIPTVWSSSEFNPEHRRPIHVFQGEATAFVELRRVLTLIQSGQVRVQEKNSRPTGKAVQLISGILATADFDLEALPEDQFGEPDVAGPVRAHAWPVLAQQCGWAKATADRLSLTKAGREMLGGVTPSAYRQGVKRFLDDDQFDEMNRITNIRGQTGKAKRDMTPPSERRKAAAQSMLDWPVGRWLTFDEADRWISASGGELIVAEDSWGLYFLEPQYGRLDGEGYDLERQYLRAMLFESTATLGLVDVAYIYPHFLWPELSGSWGSDDMAFCGRYDGLLYVRLTPLGAYCLGASKSYTPPSVPKRELFKVLPNRELAISGTSELSPGDRGVLETFAEQVGDHLWRIDGQRLLAHVEVGGSIDDARQFLEQNSAEKLPETVEVFLNDLREKADAVSGMERAILVEMKDPVSAAQVAHDAQAGKLCRLAGDRYLAVPKKNERAFRTAFRKLGYILPHDDVSTR